MEALHEKIEILRKELITTAFIYGFTAPKTLHKSQELDKLLNLLGHGKEPIGF
ncbi:MULTISPECIES: aspartyl-phosphate phosphatase Spo0E family protein [unclassified Peribacillus]|uniref:aspartyl-phosphate phosphatase Spo0E family protein n=1 Tax=unclassified Peribacillus TaxID=2675266 RepID=UPI001E5FA1E4|nr:aspartyl-phosphate phosphatase Spo0E family protein [Peribacillus sp. Bi96]